MSGQRMWRWEDVETVELARQWGVPAVHAYASVGSTNDIARELAEAGAASGTVVLADEQRSGRGREGRVWASPPGLGVWLSVVIRGPVLNPLSLPLLVGVHAARGLDPYVHPLHVAIKWPNDLILDGRKVGGILCEGVWTADGLAFAIVGIGVNVAHTASDFPPDLQPRATSILMAAGASPARHAVAGALARAALAATRDMVGVLPPDAVEELAARDALKGLPVVVDVPGTAEPLAATALGIGPDGALLVRTPSGVLRPIRSGSVRLAAESTAGVPGAIDGGGTG